MSASEGESSDLMSASEGESSDSMAPPTSPGKLEWSYIAWCNKWSYSAWSPQYSVKFTFLDGVRPDPEWSSVGSDDGRDCTLLRKALSYTTAFQIDSASSELFTDLAEVLKTDDNPVPVLREIKSSSRRICTPLLEAAKAGKLPQLTTLNLLSGCDVGDLRLLTDAISAGNLPMLSVLQFRHLRNDVTEDVITRWYLKPRDEKLKYFENLENVELADAIESLVISLERKETHLTTLEFRDCGIGSAGQLAIARVLAGGHLRRFTMESSHGLISHACWEAYSKTLGSGRVKALEYINLGGNGIDDRVVELLSQGLKLGDVKGLKEICLNHSEIGDDGLITLASLLKENLEELKTMDLGNNLIGDDGIIALASLWKDTVISLQCIMLIYNKIGDNGMIALSSLLKEGTCTRIRRFYIGGNCIMEKGFLALSDALKSGHLNSLRELEISAVNKDSFRAIVAAFAKNRFLVAKVTDFLEEHDSLELMTQLKYLRTRNKKHVVIEAELCGPNVQRVPITNAKMYLCGNPKVGKTTLRKSMQRKFWQAFCMWERQPYEEERTKGINVALLKARGKEAMSLSIWDLAGQDEYHLLHYAFFQELATGDGRGTSFIVVCNSHGDLISLRRTLEYWLRFVASSCTRGVDDPRNIFVVVNLNGGRPLNASEHHWWKQCIDEVKTRFKDYLDIFPNLFMIDVRKRKHVMRLRASLFEQSHRVLKNKLVPNICQKIQQKLVAWVRERKSFPIVSMKVFTLKAKEIDQQWSSLSIEGAAKYLSEAGVVLYIEQRKIVVLDPNWICSNILGKMLLPNDKEMIGTSPELVFRESVDLKNGSIQIHELKRYFTLRQREWEEEEQDYLVAVLLWLGICYKGENEVLFIPSLIEEDDGAQEEHWDSHSLKERHDGHDWVMGYSVEYVKDEIALAPITLWRRFQVDLGQTYGHLPFHGFSIGKYFASFVEKQMAVLVEVDVGDGSPTFDRINIFVKPQDRNAKIARGDQIDLASDIVEILLKLWNSICRGIPYKVLVVWPWLAQEGNLFDNARNLEVIAVRRLVFEHGASSEVPNWRVGVCDCITYGELLARRDIEDILRKTEEHVKQSGKVLIDCSEEVKEAVDLRILSDSILKHDHSLASEDIKGKALSSGEQDVETQFVFTDPAQSVIFKAICDVRLLVLDNKKLIQQSHDMLRSGLDEIQTRLKEIHSQGGVILQSVQGFEKVFLEDKKKSCPSYIYLGEQDSGKWVTLKAAWSTRVKFRVRFFCEFQYNEGGQQIPHEVKNQLGVDISTWKDWAEKLAPWLEVSFTILSISAKVVLNFALPGSGVLIANTGSILLDSLSSPLAERIKNLSGYTLEELNGLMNQGSSSAKTAQELTGSSVELMKKILMDLPPSDWERQVGLTKVSLKFQDRHKSESVSHVSWVCKECIDKYKQSKNGTKITEFNRAQ